MGTYLSIVDCMKKEVLQRFNDKLLANGIEI
jgi:hypothetical protein